MKNNESCKKNTDRELSAAILYIFRKEHPKEGQEGL